MAKVLVKLGGGGGETNLLAKHFEKQIFETSTALVVGRGPCGERQLFLGFFLYHYQGNMFGRYPCQKHRFVHESVWMVHFP